MTIFQRQTIYRAIIYKDCDATIEVLPLRALGIVFRPSQEQESSPFHYRIGDPPAEHRSVSPAQETGDLRWEQTCWRLLLESLGSGVWFGLLMRVSFECFPPRDRTVGAHLFRG